ncbi:stemmadenine O-acetyltransferase-like [Rosa rugosa]|uniref:stemmadenine O-acetyltransferase-like n=1 Tax=Rosa rugosa TaxID=74645 RepID=UPI002B406864|nr:stemmadenine O-acetyltransferase-like [Rosa rugosa]
METSYTLLLIDFFQWSMITNFSDYMITKRLPYQIYAYINWITVRPFDRTTQIQLSLEDRYSFTKMTLEVEVISKEIIKPSSPTPDHLRYYRFSSVDQTLIPPIYISTVHFFEFNSETQPNITEISNHLKTSLAEVLTLYYPLAGRAHDNLHIDCNDEGVPFLVAHVNNCKLSDVLCNPIPDELTKLVVFELDDVDNKIPLGVQLNVFECGGFAIGQCISHKIADGLSMLMFSRAWAATARRALGDHQAEIQHPEFISATLFPPKLFVQQPPFGVAKNKFVTKRFVFDASNIEYLRAKYVGTTMKRPSRVETLSAFIWSRFVPIFKDDGIHDHQKFHSVFHAVNLRPRFDPPLPPHSVGNLISVACSTPSLLNTGEECYGLARQIRESISKIDKDYIKRLQQGANGNVGADGNMILSYGEEKVTFMFTSLCKYPLYDSDFGWGIPSWVYVRAPAPYFNNVLVIFSDTKDTNGIEAYINSTKEVMAKLESDSEFLQRVCPSWIGSGSILTNQRTPFANLHSRNRPRMIKRPSAYAPQPKVVTWAASSAKLAVKVLKRK